MHFLTLHEVAARLHVTPLTVRRWLHAGSLAGDQLGAGGAWRIAEVDVQTFLDARRRGGVQERPARSGPRDAAGMR